VTLRRIGFIDVERKEPPESEESTYKTAQEAKKPIGDVPQRETQ
jgi:hypothetical protein